MPPLSPPTVPNLPPLLLHGGWCGVFSPGLLDSPTPTQQPNRSFLVGRYTLRALAQVTLVEVGVRSPPLLVS